MVEKSYIGELGSEKLTEEVVQRMAAGEFVDGLTLSHCNPRLPGDIKPETWKNNVGSVREWLRTPEEFEKVSFYCLD